MVEGYSKIIKSPLFKRRWYLYSKQVKQVKKVMEELRSFKATDIKTTTMFEMIQYAY